MLEPEEFARTLIRMGKLAQQRHTEPFKRKRFHLYQRIFSQLDALLVETRESPEFTAWVIELAKDFMDNHPQGFARFLYALLFKFYFEPEHNAPRPIDWVAYEEALFEEEHHFQVIQREAVNEK